MNSLPLKDKVSHRIRLRPHVLSALQFISLGCIILSPNALAKLSEGDMVKALMRHATCNWGYVTNETWRANEQSLAKNKSLFSIHYSKLGIQFYLITEADRSVTMIVLAED